MENANPVLVEVWRGEVLESQHRGLICVVNEAGEVVFSQGDVQQIIYPRSSLKPFQVIPLIELGGIEKFGFTLEEVAVMCASHNAEDKHREVVQSILNKIGLDESYFQCGAHYPLLETDARQLYAIKKIPTQLYNNCSGKHAGFLALCKLIGAPLNSYLSPTNPAQLMVRKAIAELCEYPERDLITGVDGCSAPVFAMPAYNMAVGYKNLGAIDKLTAERQKACATVVKAMATYPFMVAGNNRYDTELMEACGSEIIGKTGAEGVFGLTFYNKLKLGVSVKIDDGKMGPQYAVCQKIIEATGLFDKDACTGLHKYINDDVKNHAGLVTGSVKVREGVFKIELF